jgi:hypothetical protein
MGSRRRWKVREILEDLGTLPNIQSIQLNYRRKAFSIKFQDRRLHYPFAMVHPRPSTKDRVAEMRYETSHHEAFRYVLRSGKEGRVLAKDVLDYHRPPTSLRDGILYTLTIAALEHLETNAVSKREMIRRLRTSPTQFYRLLDPENFHKSVDGVLGILQILDCEVDVNVRRKNRTTAYPL